MTGHDDASSGRLEVWAPLAGVVELDLSGLREPMQARGNGWWRSTSPLAPGTDYAFALDGGPARPDPRSPWQPHGVHGPSRVFDADAHAWADGHWRGLDVRDAVVYELHVGAFTAEGTLDAAITRLGHLRDLGVTMVELMPVAAFNGSRGWGYDGVALWAVQETYGGPAALQRFVDAAHAHGLAVCLDVVHNHLGPSGNYLAEFGPYLTDRHHTPWGQAVNLDGPDSGPVREFVVDNAVRWLRDFHVDALRLDAVHALIDDSPAHVLAEMSVAVAALAQQVGRPLSLIAESDLNDAKVVMPVTGGGWGMTAQWADDVHHALHALVTGEKHGYYVDFGSPADLAKTLTEVFWHDGEWSTFRGKPWGLPVPEGVDGRSFVVYASNHDQVGNRGLGDRPSQYLPPGLLAASAALVLCSPFTPMLFMGEEWGARTPFQFFADHPEPELSRAVREGRAREFGEHGWDALYGEGVEAPDPGAPSTFAASRLNWEELSGESHARLLTWHRDLIALRAAEPELRDGDRSATEVTWDESGAWLMMRRGSIAVVVALAQQHVTVPLPDPDAPVVLAWDASTSLVDGRLTLPGAGAAIVRLG